MSDTAVVDEDTTDSATDIPAPPTALSDLLVEDVSIDGMCGVY